MMILLPFALTGNDSVTNADLSRKLDLIIGKFGELENRVSKLENDNRKVKEEVREVAITAREAGVNLAIPDDPEKKNSFFKDLRNKLNSEGDKSSGPWARVESWSKIRKNQTRYQIRMLLGDPHEVNLSLSPRIDQVYKYSGDLNADGKQDLGIVNFYRDRVVSFTSPH